jgi:phage shock protein PspC (stress-responsive transcriptional regulator)
MTPIERPPRLHRSTTDKVVAGVCGGLAATLQVDASLVRIGFVIATIWGGIGLIVYIALALILPAASDVQPNADDRRTERTRALAGLLLVAFGAMLLVGNMGWLPWFSWEALWAGVLILMGLALLWRSGASADGTV